MRASKPQDAGQVLSAYKKNQPPSVHPCTGGWFVVSDNPLKLNFSGVSAQSIRADRGRIVLQKVARAASRVVRIGGLSARWTGVEVLSFRITTGVRAET